MVNIQNQPKNNRIAEFANLVELLRWRASEQGNNKAYTFLEDGEQESANLTYQQLDLQARAIAASLQTIAKKGDRALLLYPSGLEFIAAFLGCLYAGVVAVPAYPPRPNQKIVRLKSVVADAQAHIALTTKSLLPKIREQFAEESELTAIKWLATDAVEVNLAANWKLPEICSDTLAFLQYTSGSTGNPKGVMVSHNNLMHNERLIKMAFGHSQKTIFVGWLPLFHDMGLIGNVLQPLYLGIPCVLMAPTAFLQKPIRWLQAISRYKATTSGGPNFAYELCARKITPEQCEGLDLSSWDVAFNGSEPIRAEVLEQFASAFKPCGFKRQAFYPCYGMAETTLFVSGGLKNAPPVLYPVDTAALAENRVVAAFGNEGKSQTIVGCGQTFFDKIAIANPETKTLSSPNEVGEIWVSGQSVAQGYWNRQELTQETFNAYLADTNQGPFLRTGDLGFMKEDGEIFITGRLKDVLIIRGRNHYPQDIELTVEKSHAALREGCGAAVTIEVDGSEKLVIVQEVERTHLRKLNVDEVVEAIRKAVSQEHELAVHAVNLLKTTSIPKTSSGKLQRHACKARFIDGTLESVGSWMMGEIGKDGRDVAPLPLENVEDARDVTPLRLGDDAPVDEFTSPEISRERADRLIDWVREYANKRLNSRLMDERRCIAPYVVLDLGNQGFFGMQVPEKYGGLGLRTSDMVRVIEQVAAIDLSLATFIGVNNTLGVRPIQRYATAEMKAQILPILAQGRQLAAFAVTEPGAGSAVRSVSSKAIPDGQGGWKLRGTKIWSGSSAWAGFINVFAQVVDENDQPDGFAGFVVPQGSPGLRMGPEALTMGMRAMVQNTVYLEDVPVTRANLLGEIGQGFVAAQDTMMFARLGIAAMSLGGMKRCFQIMHRYGSNRTIATGRLLDNPVTLCRMNELGNAIATVDTLVSTVTGLMDAGVEVPEEALVACKTSAPEFFWKGVDNLVQLLGGRGYVESNLVPQMFRDARLFRIFEGPTETLNMHLGSSVVHNSEPLFRFLSQTLGMPQIADNLRNAGAQIKERCLSSPSAVGETSSALRWAYILTGELATYGILLAILKYRHSAKLERAIAWIEDCYADKLADAIEASTSQSMLVSVDATNEMLAEYELAIGDLEQTLAGEDLELNDLLRRQAPTRNNKLSVETGRHGDGETRRRGDAEIRISPTLSQNQEMIPTKLPLPQVELQVTAPAKTVSQKHFQPTKVSAEAIQDWVVKWLSQQIKVSTQAINPSKSFADYGMDSVVAVELAQDLGEWLHQPLDATVAWNFPTIKALSVHLASESQSVKPESPSPVVALEPPKVEYGIESLSEAEIARLLADEIAQIR
ncbi:AMP-binding protein [Merismopedia glauca]|uniref:AMP-dependent synthetase n=1 Tax=Merismopedia glauca CCAP 1448/3 TaxID=1296344 RepID=A0A2T1C6R0_9CYAN|nr:AMP-binding protein [Merismopedia glauca]PSB03926.1 AMP-dependent synthetase [Merismopedia glauca CCAP 1448/3]